jgi:hypothetical protein
MNAETRQQTKGFRNQLNSELALHSLLWESSRKNVSMYAVQRLNGQIIVSPLMPDATARHLLHREQGGINPVLQLPFRG